VRALLPQAALRAKRRCVLAECRQRFGKDCAAAS